MSARGRVRTSFFHARGPAATRESKTTVGPSSCARLFRGIVLAGRRLTGVPPVASGYGLAAPVQLARGGSRDRNAFVVRRPGRVPAVVRADGDGHPADGRSDARAEAGPPLLAVARTQGDDPGQPDP